MGSVTLYPARAPTSERTRPPKPFSAIIAVAASSIFCSASSLRSPCVRRGRFCSCACAIISLCLLTGVFYHECVQPRGHLAGDVECGAQFSSIRDSRIAFGARELLSHPLLCRTTTFLSAHVPGTNSCCRPIPRQPAGREPKQEGGKNVENEADQDRPAQSVAAKRRRQTIGNDPDDHGSESESNQIEDQLEAGGGQCAHPRRDDVLDSCYSRSEPCHGERLRDGK